MSTQGSTTPESKPAKDAAGSDLGMPTPNGAAGGQRSGSRLRHILFGKPRDLADRSLFHRVSLIAFLAWVGLGADGLSSAAYGPAEAFLALGEHRYLALLLALVTAGTVILIAAAYSRIIEAFPQGGGGYVVASSVLGPSAGVVSGCALIVDYVLTITVSIAAAGDALASLIPPEYASLREFKMPIEIGFILLLIALNIRGVREAVLPLVPVFLLFVFTHALLILGGIIQNAGNLPETAAALHGEFKTDIGAIGITGMLAIFFMAYSMGAGTYTGIEAVSNGIPMMREPRVRTGLHTMRYMSISLAVTAAGLMVCFLLSGIHPQEGKTLNAVLIGSIFSDWPGGWALVMLTLLSEGALLVVAAQAGFIDGPRVLANMAVDGWVPRRFASLSERFTTMNGIVLMGAGAMAALIWAQGDLHTLIILYAINVFITFTLSMAAMVRHTIVNRRRGLLKKWKGRMTLFISGLAVCATILGVTIFEKFLVGGWVTILVTGGFVIVCFVIRKHYRTVRLQVAMLERIVDLPAPGGAAKGAESAPPPRTVDPTRPTAIILAGGYNGLGIHTAMAALQAFRGHFKNLVFVSVGVVDSAAFRSEAELRAVRTHTEEDLKRYLNVADRLGIPATYRCAIGTDPVDELEKLAPTLRAEFTNSTFFAGKLIFQKERWYHSLLHNQTAYSLQRRLQWAGIPVLILPIRVH